MQEKWDLELERRLAEELTDDMTTEQRSSHESLIRNDVKLAHAQELMQLKGTHAIMTVCYGSNINSLIFFMQIKFDPHITIGLIYNNQLS